MAMANKLGVHCKSCGREIEIDEVYLPGICGAETAASLYEHLSKPVVGMVVNSGFGPWRETLTCENPSCRATHTYTADDLRLYND